MSGFDYINRTYGLSLSRGDRCIYSGGGRARSGTVMRAVDAYIKVRFDDDPSRVVGPFHPTWEMSYPKPPVSP